MMPLKHLSHSNITDPSHHETSSLLMADNLFSTQQLESINNSLLTHMTPDAMLTPGAYALLRFPPSFT
jgi:hypothetical protein